MHKYGQLIRRARKAQCEEVDPELFSEVLDALTHLDKNPCEKCAYDRERERAETKWGFKRGTTCSISQYFKGEEMTMSERSHFESLAHGMAIVMENSPKRPDFKPDHMYLVTTTLVEFKPPDLETP